MKQIRITLLPALLLCSFVACKKGDTGSPGTNGVNGNANIRVFNYSSRTFQYFTNYVFPADVTQGGIDSSLVLAYYNSSMDEDPNAWYPMSGLSAGGFFQIFTRVAFSGIAFEMEVTLSNKTADAAYPEMVTFRKVKIVMAPGSTIETLNAKGIDPGNYKDVQSVLALKN